MLYFLNNCQNLDHAGRYGGDAIFDLWARGFEDKIVSELRPGDTCLVASRKGKDKVVISRCAFTGVREAFDTTDTNRKIWVLDGTRKRSEVLPKADAARHAVYSRFFNKLGHFKQQSVMRGS